MFRSLVFFAALSLSALCHADPAEELAERLSAIHSLSGQFTQQQMDGAGELAQTTQGSFALLLPNYFRWDIQSPDSQLLIADPEFLWQYDRDLDTVTRRPIGSTEAATPLQVLAGSAQDLAERFAVSHTGDESWQLLPRGSDAGFTSLELIFEQGALTRMEIVDSLEQQVTIQFSALSEAPLSPEDFAFTPPEDSDQFFYDQ